MKKIIYFFLLLLFAAIYPLQKANASHAQGGDISYINIAPNTFLVTFNFYRDCNGINANNSEVLTYRAPGCQAGSTLALQRASVTIGNPYCNQVFPTCSGSFLPNYETHVYTGTIILPQPCVNWMLSTKINARNSSRNLMNQGYLYSEALINNVDAANNNSPNFNNLPVIYVCKDQGFSYSDYMQEQDGDSVNFVLTTALNDLNIPMNYVSGFSETNPFGPNANPGLILNNSTGKIFAKPNNYDSLSASQLGKNKYTVVIQVNEFRQINPGNWVKIGHVRRDMLVTVLKCGSNNIPYFTSMTFNNVAFNPTTVIDIVAGQQNNIQLTAQDQDFGDYLSYSSNVSSVFNNAVISQSGGPRPIGTLSITPQVSDIRTKPYTILVNVKDDFCPLNGKNTELIAVRVVAASTIGLSENLTNKYNLQTILTANGDGTSNHLILHPDLKGASVTVYSPEGRLLKSFIHYDNRWSATDVAAGMYIYQVQHPVTGQILSSRLFVRK